ncbi:flagellin N-terminal helical domain-containing protein [Rhizobium terrae]|uniref:flagellin N-terminal helical domain-containing protein n=1 Tax=Rhizobium terrae TaxID=2171756 RepID=UPI000E3C11F3|nr:flagellin [Rhizobium terrae]
MTSILTNAAAVAALQTLRFLSGQMSETQQQVSSGLRIGKAEDNSAYWSIATTMRSDNGALSAVQDALGLGAAQVDTAYSGMESAIDVVEEIKMKLVAASEAGVDKAKIQEEISQLQDQLRSISSSASFSGDNWLQADLGGAYDASSRQVVATDKITKQVVGSFIRDGSGNVSVNTVRVDIDESNVLFDLSGGHAGILDQGVLVGVRATGYFNTAGQEVYVKTTDFNPNWTQEPDGKWFDGMFRYIELDGAYMHWLGSAGGGPYQINISTEATLGAANYVNEISVSTLDITKIDDYKTKLQLGTNAQDGQVLATLISHVDQQLEKIINAAAVLGSVVTRISMQEDFVSKLRDSIDRGVGRLVDAEMNEASTRLKALQTQQQLATQSLSIANAGAENILSLFRQ